MAKIVMFMRDELTSIEEKRNEEFRNIVKEFVPYIIEGEITFAEYNVNTPFGFMSIFDENPDCELVFTTENSSEAQFEACKRRYLTFEWRCFTNRKLVPITVRKDTSYGYVSYEINTYSVLTSF